MVNIWLDDIRPAPDNWIWAKTVSEMLEAIINHKGNVNIISLDHDLGTKETGYDFVKAIIEYPELFPRQVYLHTSNPVGRDAMHQTLKRYIERYNLDTKLHYGPHVWSWEESMRKIKLRGGF